MNISVNNIYRNNYYLKNLKSSNDIKSKKTVPNISNNEVAFKSLSAEFFQGAMTGAAVVGLAPLIAISYISIKNYIESHKIPKFTNDQLKYIEQAEKRIQEAKNKVEQLRNYLSDVKSGVQESKKDVIIDGKQYKIKPGIQGDIVCCCEGEHDFLTINHKGELSYYSHEDCQESANKYTISVYDDGKIKYSERVMQKYPFQDIYTVRFNKNGQPTFADRCSNYDKIS